MELNSHDGPVYELHRVFRLGDVGQPKLESVDSDPTFEPLPQTGIKASELSRLSPPGTAY